MRSIQRWIRAKAGRLVPMVAVFGLLAGGAVVQVAMSTPAFAASTLCTGFTACEASPYTDHGWGSNYTNSYWGQYAGDNCTDYVAYYEQHVNGMSSTRPSWLAPNHNADGWATEASAAGITVSNTPVVGAIAQWGDYGWNGNAGHVGIVESVSNGGATVEVSWDSYSAGPYKWVQLNSSDANTSTAVGWPNAFIYAGGVGSGGGGTTLADGTFFQNSGSPTVYEMVGGAALVVPSWASVGGYHAPTTISPTWFPSTPKDGTFIEDYGSSAVYEMLGGAAVYVPSWASVGGYHAPVVIPNTYSYPSTPEDGTLFDDYGSTAIYEVAGGAEVYVPSWASIGGSQPYAVVPSSYSLPTTPANGTFIKDFGYPNVYEMAGGAAFEVPYWGAVGGEQNFVVIPATVFPQYPVDGTYIEEYGASTVDEVVGGAPVGVWNWSNVGGVQPVAQVPTGAIAAQLRQYPADGTFVEGYGSSTVHEMAGGAALAVSSWSAVGGPYPVVTIDPNGFSGFLSYPTDGTYVKGYTSGEEFEASGGVITRVTTSPLPAATTVDDWAIVNQLGGTE